MIRTDGKGESSSGRGIDSVRKPVDELPAWFRKGTVSASVRNAEVRRRTVDLTLARTGKDRMRRA